MKKKNKHTKQAEELRKSKRKNLKDRKTELFDRKLVINMSDAEKEQLYRDSDLLDKEIKQYEKEYHMSIDDVRDKPYSVLTFLYPKQERKVTLGWFLFLFAFCNIVYLAGGHYEKPYWYAKTNDYATLSHIFLFISACGRKGVLGGYDCH